MLIFFIDIFSSFSKLNSAHFGVKFIGVRPLEPELSNVSSRIFRKFEDFIEHIDFIEHTPIVLEFGFLHN